MERGELIQALVIGQPLTAEILRILEDFEISEVRFFGPHESPANLPRFFDHGTPYQLMILNPSAMPRPLYDTAQRLARERRIEILEFSQARRNV